MAAVGATPSANAASLAGQVLTLQPADGTNPGVVTTGSQTIAGTKTFSGTISASNLSGTNTGDVTVTAVGATPNANGVSLSGQALTLQPADGTNPGVVTTDSQTLAGAKTFSSTIAASNLSGTNTGDVTLAAVGATPSANGASLSGQVLTLQPASAAQPGVITTGTQTIAGAKSFSSDIVTFGFVYTDAIIGYSGAASTIVSGYTNPSIVLKAQTALTGATEKIVSIRNASVEKAQVTKDGEFFGGMGTATGTLVHLGGIIASAVTAVGNVGTGEDDLHTYTLPANAFILAARTIRGLGYGTFTNNTNAKTLKMYFGSLAHTVSIPISIGGHWSSEFVTKRNGASTQVYYAKVEVVNSATNLVVGTFISQGTLTESETAAIIIKHTGEATANNDIVQTLSTYEYT